MTSVFGYCKADPSIPIDELDYGFIEKCKDIDKLQKILEILRSGEQGIYPSLEQFTEKQLAAKKTVSPLLEKCNREKTMREMPKEDITKTVNELKNLSTTNNGNADVYATQKRGIDDYDYLPPIRNSENVQKQKDSDEKEPVNVALDSKNGNLRKSITPKGPEYWSQLIKQVDAEEAGDYENICKEKTTKSQLLQSNVVKNYPKPAHELLTEQQQPQQNNRVATYEDINFVAQNEKNKGNEAFRCGDYKEALVYYNRSLNIFPTAASYNNRAVTFIKLEKFQEALDDCEKVISLEQNNMKAYMRRGIANQSLDHLEKALIDFTKVVTLEPNNKRGKDLLDKVKQKLIENESVLKKKGTRMNIEEIDISMQNEDNLNNKTRVIKPFESTCKKFETQGIDNAFSTVQKVSSALNVNLDGTRVVGECYNIKEKIHSTEDNIKNEELTQNECCNFYGSKEYFNQDKLKIERTVIPVDQSKRSDESDENRKKINTILKESKGTKMNNQPVLELPPDIGEQKNKGNHLYKTGQYDKACEVYTLCIDTLMENKFGYKNALAVLFSNRSSCQMKMGNSKQSVFDCDKSIALFPSAKVYSKRAIAYESLEKYLDAYVDYQNVLKLDPSSINALQALSRLGTVLRSHYGDKWRDKLHKTDHLPLLSMNSVDTIILNKPENNENSSQKKNVTGADESKSISKESITHNSDKLNCEAGTDLKQVKSYDEKENISVQVNAKEPSYCDKVNFNAKSNDKRFNMKTEISAEKMAKENRVLDFFETKEKGNICVQKGKHEEAAKYYTKCVELLPTEIPSYTNRALCYLKLKKPVKAIEDCSQALKLQPSCVKALFRRAQARKMTKEYKDALADLAKVLKIEPNNNAAKKELEQCKTEFHAELRNIQAQNEAAKKKDIGKGKNVPIEEIMSAEFSVKGKMSTKVGKCPLAKGTTSQRSIQSKKMTGFEFLHAWNNIKSDKTSDYAELLIQVDVNKMPELLSNKLDGEILKNLIRTVNEHFTNKESFRQGIQLLKSLCKVSRFLTMLLFLNTTEKSLLRCTIDLLETRVRQSKETSLFSDVNSLRTSYQCS